MERFHKGLLPHELSTMQGIGDWKDLPSTRETTCYDTERTTSRKVGAALARRTMSISLARCLHVMSLLPSRLFPSARSRNALLFKKYSLNNGYKVTIV